MSRVIINTVDFQVVREYNALRYGLLKCGSFFFFEKVYLKKGGDKMFDLIFDILIILIEIIQLILQIKEYKNNNRTRDVVVIIIIKN